MNKLYNGDCLEIMQKLIDDGVKVDMILTDPPYGTTACKWDSVIPFDKMWEKINLLVKDNGAIVLFGSEPFSSHLRISNIKHYKYDWIWEKSNPSGMGLANKQPMRYHELISVFYKNQPNYNKQMIKRESSRITQAHKSNYKFNVSNTMTGNQQSKAYKNIDAKKYDKDFKNPSTILKVNSLRANSKEWNKHPTQKPVELLEYLIKTYTNENELVLDFTMGSGSTGVACLNTNRDFIGIELDKGYFDIAKERIEKVEEDKQLELLR